MKVSRRTLALLSSSGLAAFAGKANAATAFTSFAFTATGEPTARTMPDRLAEIKNVLDFGADATGVADSTTAIQAAVNWTSGANRGTIYFPIGSYKTSAPITFNTAGLNICFRGEGNGTQIIAGGFSSGGYVFDRHLGSPSNTAQVLIEKLSLQFDSTVTGGVRLGSCNSIAARDCNLGSLTTEDSAGNSSQNFLLENCAFAGLNGGIVIGSSGTVLECGFKNCLTAIRAYGKGFYIGGCRVENSGSAYLLGLDSAGTDQNASGFAIIGGTMEGNWIDVDFSGTCSAFYLGGLEFLGHNYTNAGPNTTAALTISYYTYNSGSGLVTLTMAATVPALMVTGSGIGTTGLNIAGLNGSFTCATASGTTVTFTGPTGQAGSPSGGGTLGMGQQYGIWVRANKASYGVFQGLNAGNYMDVAGGQIDAATSRANLLFLNCTFNQSGGAGVGWVTPSNAYTAQFQQCNTDPIWIFSQLPTGGNVLEGDQFSISDSTTNTWGANVTVGSGGDRVLVRYNGSNYTVVAK